MSALNVILHQNAAHLISDGAAFSGNAFKFQTTKAFPLPHLRAVVGVRGAPAHLPMMSAAIGMAADNFDAMKLRAVRAIREAESDWAPSMAWNRNTTFDVVVAGLACDGTPEAFFITTEPLRGPTYEVVQLGSANTMPCDIRVKEGLRENIPAFSSYDELDPERVGLQMLELQRERPEWGIGGFAQLTTVTAAGISTRIIHRWDSTPDLGAADAA